MKKQHQPLQCASVTIVYVYYVYSVSLRLVSTERLRLQQNGEAFLLSDLIYLMISHKRKKWGQNAFSCDVAITIASVNGSITL